MEMRGEEEEKQVKKTKESKQDSCCRYVASTILSVTHVQALKMETETAAPGEKAQFLGVRCEACNNKIGNKDILSSI